MPKNKTEFSKQISNISSLIMFISEQYLLHFDEMNRQEKLTQDYLHKLELEEMTYRERAKIATQLSKCRKLRRQSKDTVEVLQPIIEFLDKGNSFSDSKDLLNKLGKLLGEVRKKEKCLENRQYKFKVLESENIGGE